MASVGKKRRERWTITAENELREAVETRGGPDSNVDWEGVARDLETTVHRVKKKWYLLSSLVTAASNASWFGPPSPAPENWLVAARIPPEYAPNFSGKNSGGNGSFKRRNG